jgi:hypothetical protein
MYRVTYKVSINSLLPSQSQITFLSLPKKNHVQKCSHKQKGVWNCLLGMEVRLLFWEIPTKAALLALNEP